MTRVAAAIVVVEVLRERAVVIDLAMRRGAPRQAQADVQPSPDG